MFQTLKQNKKIFIIALPIALQNLINIGVGFLDTIMIGSINETQLSAVGQANQLYFVFSLIMFGLIGGAGVILSRYEGQNNMEAIGIILGFMLKIVLIISCILSFCIFIFPQFFISIFTNDPNVIAQGVKYLRIIAFSYVLSGLTTTYLLGIRNISNVNTALKIYGCSFLVNLVLNWLLIFGNFGCPRLEIEGAAIATIIARAVEFLLVLIYMFKWEKKLKFRPKYFFKSIKPYFKNLFKISIPVVFSELHWGIGMAIQAAFIGRLGENIMAAVQVVKIIQDLAAISLIGLGCASCVVIGQMVGEGRANDAKKMAKELIVLAFIIGTILTAIVLALIPVIPNMINASSETRKRIKELLYVSCYLIFSQSVTFVGMMGIMRAGGRTRFCAIMDIIVLYLQKILIAYLIIFVFKLPIFWCYFILCSDEFIKMFIVIPFVFKEKWLVKNFTIN